MAQKKKDNSSLLVKFLKSFIISAVSLSFIVGVITLAYVYLNKDTPQVEIQPDDTPSVITPDNDEELQPVENPFTTFLIYGVDQEGIRTDVIMLAVFNAKTSALKMISVPRDTRIQLPDDTYAELKARRSDVPKTMKINEIPSYSYPDKRNETSVKVFEQIFNVDVDYYVNMDLKGFRNIVDLIEGVDMYIPDDFDYKDPVQNLYINLKKGQQNLNGDKAEQLIRYRKGYSDGDLGRIDMQHEFMKAFMSKLLTDKNQLNILDIATNVLLHVETNFTKGLDYIQYLDTFSVDDIQMERLPGESKWVGKISYYIADKEKSAELMQSFYVEEQPVVESNDTQETSNDDKKPVEKPIEIDSKTLNIEILNSTKITGFAAKTKDKLVRNGFDGNKITVDNYKEEVLKKTKIMVEQEGAGLDILNYFKEPELMVSPEQLPEQVHIRIILGSDDGE